MGGTVISVLGGILPFKANFIFFVLVAVVGYGIYLPYQERRKYGPSQSKHKKQSDPKAKRWLMDNAEYEQRKEVCPVRRRRVTYRPSKAQGAFGVAVGAVFVIIGLVMVIPIFGLFGVLWTLIAVGITAMNAYQAFGKGYTGPEITIEDESDISRRESAPSSPASETHDHISSTSLDVKGRLEQLKELKEAGLLTQEEYDKKRQEILKGL